MTIWVLTLITVVQIGPVDWKQPTTTQLVPQLQPMKVYLDKQACYAKEEVMGANYRCIPLTVWKAP